MFRLPLLTAFRLFSCPVPQVRLQVLQSFGPDFDRYLARAQHVNTLLLLLADEVFDIKVTATRILGRLANVNPAAVLPPIRQQLIHLISEMQNCPDYRTIEEAALMLCSFLRLAKFHVLVRPFMVTLISTLPLQSDFRATTAALEALGELSIVLQNDILPYMDSLLPIVITHMLDSSSYRKQEVAVKTLGQVVSSTGLVVGPYLHYPQLLPSALDLLYRNSTSRPESLRMEVLRTLGLLGALEPNRYALIATYLQGRDKDRNKRDDPKALGAGDSKEAVVLRSGG
jgi:FKBP12-rapamycin complex-associated protein